MTDSKHDFIFQGQIESNKKELILIFLYFGSINLALNYKNNDMALLDVMTI
jgi:hypothetical protein